MIDNRLTRRVLEFIQETDPGPARFEVLALDIFRHQWQHNEDYRRLLQGRGLDPTHVVRWDQVPAVSTVAFKRLRLACGPSSIVFRTSGTTRGDQARGAHHLADTQLYEAALRRQFRTYLLPDLDRIRFLTLTPAPTWAVDSSLGFMMADLHQSFGIPGSRFFLGPEGVDLEALTPALAEAEASGLPVCLAGVAFAFVQLLDALRERGLAFRLPQGSRIMDTGGFKGRSRSVDRADLLAGYQERLGIAPNRVVNEYGMTELSSQFYDGSFLGDDPTLMRGPHWLRTEVVDPVTGMPLPEGGIGLLRHYDLANVDSVLAVETEDLGVRYGAGFRLLGRAAGSEPRGCSLLVPDPPVA